MNNLLIYLDNCCFNRPFDDQSSLSVFLETQAKLTIQDFIKDNLLSLAWSFILDFENSANPDESIKEDIFTWKALSYPMIHFEEKILMHAEKLTQSGFGKKDALHIACALKAKADFFITVDKGIIKKAALINDIKIVNPTNFIDYPEEADEN
jgi:hypothetical protein